jgi:hypothetical protein
MDCGKIFNPLTAMMLASYGFFMAFRRGRTSL